MVTRKDVARLAGVSEATVSRVFSHTKPMTERTKQKVLAAAKEMNYHPNAIAQSFAQRKSGNIGVILPSVPKVHLFSTFYFSEILSGIGEAVSTSGYDLLLKLHSMEEKPDYTALFLRQKVDGCILLGTQDTPEQRESLICLKEMNVPFVIVNQHFPGLNLLEVGADHVSGSKQAVQHLCEQGFTRIGFLNGPMEYSNSLDRLTGYRLALEAANLKFDPKYVYEGNYSRTSGYQAARKIAASNPKVDAVFASNDRMAIGLMQGLQELGEETLEQIAFVGYDNSDASRLSVPQLSSVHVPFYDMGRTAVQELLRWVEGVQEDSRRAPILLPVSLVVRKSSISAKLL